VTPTLENPRQTSGALGSNEYATAQQAVSSFKTNENSFCGAAAGLGILAVHCLSKPTVRQLFAASARGSYQSRRVEIPNALDCNLPVGGFPPHPKGILADCGQPKQCTWYSRFSQAVVRKAFPIGPMEWHVHC
jgi:hypothetical protein